MNEPSVIDIPQDVILAAKKVADWVQSTIPGARNVTIYGVGVRHFLSVEAMLLDDVRGGYISELVGK